MSRLGPNTSVRDLLANPEAKAAVEAALPEFAAALATGRMPLDMPVSIPIVMSEQAIDDYASLWDTLGQIQRDDSHHAGPVAPDPDYEPVEVPRASAAMTVPAIGRMYEMVQLEIDGPSHGNPFVDVDFRATFSPESGDPVQVGGFYAGDGRYLIRFLPPAPGR